MRADLFANMKMVDLSLPIYDDAPIWSAEPRCIVHDWIVRGRTHGSREPLNMKYFCMAGHQSTHTDAPYHMNDDGDKISDIPLDRYMGWCKVLDFTDKKLGDHFSADDLVKRGVTDGDRILLHTAWDRYLDPFDETYFNMDHPHFSEEAIFWVLEHKLQLVGMDVPSTDPYLVDHPKIFREKDNYPIILELLTNLDKIVGKEVYLLALPLNVSEGDGSWVRAVAFAPDN
jgi:arylformamidase